MISTNLCTVGVQKLGRYIPAFNLPRNKDICIGMTKECEKYCYAKRYHFKGETVIAKYNDNYRRTKLPGFKETMIQELKHYSFQSIDRLRLHSSGDFYSQEYLDNWKQIAYSVPDITIVAYTRSYQLDYSNTPDNLKLFYSLDSSTVNFPDTLKRWAIVYHKKDHLKNTIPNTFICKSHCHSCKACFVESKKDVIFFRH